MIIGYVCCCCQGVADKVIQAKYTKDGVDVRLGYVCEGCKDEFYKQHREHPNSQWLWKDWQLVFDITDQKSVDLLAIYGKKPEKLHKKF